MNGPRGGFLLEETDNTFYLLVPTNVIKLDIELSGKTSETLPRKTVSFSSFYIFHLILKLENEKHLSINLVHTITTGSI